MKKSYLKTSILLCIVLFFYACEKEELTPEQIERNKIIEIEDALRDNLWGFQDLKVTVRYESKAVPLLANVADENGMVQPGIYDSYDIFGNGNRQISYSYDFTRDEITVDTVGNGEYSRIGGYYVFNREEIRINLDTASALRFAYDYNSDDGIFTFTTDQVRSERLVEAVNDRIINSIITGNPGDIADAVVNKLLESEEVSEAIESFLYDLIHGKIEEITELIILSLTASTNFSLRT
jgi:hypothetical protein